MNICNKNWIRTFEFVGNPNKLEPKILVNLGTIRLSASAKGRNFQNVKLRLDLVKIWSFYSHSDFTWNPILVNSISPKMSFLAILDTELWILVNVGLESCSNLLKSKFRTSKIAKNDIFELFDFTKIGFHVKPE